EDGIRDKLVTGVQTCALPISRATLPWRGARPVRAPGRAGPVPRGCHGARVDGAGRGGQVAAVAIIGFLLTQLGSRVLRTSWTLRSEERRVGEGGRSRWWPRRV